jgi:hypothetical protein
MRVVVDTRLRRLSSREDRARAEGLEVVESRRVGESRIRWILRVGWAVWRVEMVEVRVEWVEVVEAEVR